MRARLQAPRSVFIDFPLGHQCGKPHDTDMQISILKDTLDVLVKAATPGELVDLPYEWDSPFDWVSYRKDMEEMLNEEGGAGQDWKPK